MTSVTAEKLAALAAQYIARYSYLIGEGEAGNPSVRVSECRYYLSIWQAIDATASKFSMSDVIAWTQLTVDQRHEVMDALYDEGEDIT